MKTSDGKDKKPESDLNYEFSKTDVPENPDENKLTCVSKQNDNWGGGACSLVTKKLKTGQTIASCVCPGVPSPTSVLNDIGAFFA